MEYVRRSILFVAILGNSTSSWKASALFQQQQNTGCTSPDNTLKSGSSALMGILTEIEWAQCTEKVLGTNGTTLNADMVFG